MKVLSANHRIRFTFESVLFGRPSICKVAGISPWELGKKKRIGCSTSKFLALSVDLFRSFTNFSPQHQEYFKKIFKLGGTEESPSQD